MEGMSKEGQSNRDAIADIRGRMLRGELSYEQAQALAAPVIAAMNKRGAEISKEHGFKFKPLSFKYLMR